MREKGGKYNRGKQSTIFCDMKESCYTQPELNVNWSAAQLSRTVKYKDVQT